MAAIVVMLFVVDHPRLYRSYRNQMVTLDSAVTDEAELTSRTRDPARRRSRQDEGEAGRPRQRHDRGRRPIQASDVGDGGVVSSVLDPLPDVLPHISLDELNAHAELLTRTDRKYIVTNEHLAQLIESNRAHLAMLDIEGRREFSYESVYFDTTDLRLYRDAATSRRFRFKVRTRIYRDTATRCSR